PAELAEDLAPLTVTPIPPPPEHEMPQLSLAALAGAVTAPANPRTLAARLPGGSRGIGPPGSSSSFIRPPSSGFTPHTPSPRAALESAAVRGPDSSDAPINPFTAMLTATPTSSISNPGGILDSVYSSRAAASGARSQSPSRSSAVERKQGLPWAAV